MEAQPDSHDVRRAAATLRGLLTSNAAGDWPTRAGELTWSVTDVVAHLADVCGFYAIHLALRSPRRLRFDVLLHPTATVTDRVATVDALTMHLAQIIETAPADARAWHRWGMADTAGFAAMACDELLVHGGDIAAGWAHPFDPDRDLCARVLARLFPWAPHTADPWDALGWANGRIALPEHPRLPPDWAWLGAPLTEWNGQRPTDLEPPDAYAWDRSRRRWLPA